MPNNTTKNTNWAVNVWKSWSSNRGSHAGIDCPPHHFLCSKEILNFWLSRFVLEARRQDGTHYPPETLYGLVCGVFRAVKESHPTFNLFGDPEFHSFRQVLDGEMRRLRSLGYSVTKRKAEPLSFQEEDRLWSLGLLGESSPQILLDTMVFLCGLFLL